MARAYPPVDLGPMVVKINAIEVTEGRGPELEERFAKRAGEVEGMPGFLGFELLRPAKGETPLLRLHALGDRGGLPRLGEVLRVHARARPGGQGQQGHRRPRLRADGVRSRRAGRAGALDDERAGAGRAAGAGCAGLREGGARTRPPASASAGKSATAIRSSPRRAGDAERHGHHATEIHTDARSSARMSMARYVGASPPDLERNRTNV